VDVSWIHVQRRDLQARTSFLRMIYSCMTRLLCSTIAPTTAGKFEDTQMVHPFVRQMVSPRNLLQPGRAFGEFESLVLSCRPCRIEQLWIHADLVLPLR